MVKHIIVTRLYYDDIDMFEKRVKLMKETLIPSLRCQTNQDFIFAICADNFVDELKESVNYPYLQFLDFDSMLEYCKDNSINIQTRIDSDDMMFANYVEFVNHKAMNQPIDAELLLNFNAQYYDISNDIPLDRYMEYHNEKTSMFLSLISNKLDKHVYQHPHDQMWKYVRSVETIDGYVYYGWHDDQIMKMPIEKRSKLRQERKVS